MATEKLQIVIDAEFKGKRGIDDANKGLENLDKNARTSGQSFQNFKTHIGGISAGLVAAGVVFQQTYQKIGEGAQLEKAAMQFDNLVASIGSTSDAMLGDLRAATSGMLSDAELMAGASQIISLGLADSQEGVVRLSTAVSTLGLDMQQVILTFANNSTARLDALGLSIEDVTSKAAELEAQGFVGDAFDEAVIIALEEKMLLLGDAAGTTAGEMAIFEATLANTFNEAKIMMAERWQGVFFGLNTAIGLTQREFSDVNSGMAAFAWGLANPIEALRVLGGEFGVVENKYSDVQKEAASYDRALMGMNFTQKDTAEAIDKTAFAFEEYSDAADMYATQARENTTLTEHEAAKFAYLSEQAGILRDELMEATYGHEEFADAAMMYASQAETNSTLTEQQANYFRYLGEQSQIAAEKVDTMAVALAGTFKEYLALDDPVQAYNDMLGITDDTLVKVSGRTADQEQALRNLRQEQQRVQEQILSYEMGVRGAGLSEEERAEKIAELNERIGELNTAMEPLNAITNEYETVAGNSAINQQALNEQIFAAISANSDNAAAIALAAGELGIYDDAQVEAALNAALVEEKIRQLTEEWDGTQAGLVMVRTELRGFIEDLNAVPSERTVSFKLDIPPIPSELSGQPTGVKQTQQGPAVFGASGLDFTVPPGFPNDSFGPIFVQSGEHVKVTPAGETSSNGKGGGNTINVYAYPGMSANAIASAVNQQLVVGG